MTDTATTHPPNWENRTLWTGDNLDVLRGMNSGCVDLIYLDPPFNSNADYAAPIGSKAAGAAFKDSWTLNDVDLAWHGEIAEREPALYAIIDAAGLAHSKGMKAYLIMMAVRVIQLRRVLKERGTLYLHCNQDAGHYLKLLMDSIFGKAQFITEIVWNYGTPSGGRSGGKKPVKVHDHLLVYAKRYGQHLYNKQFTPYSEKYKAWFRNDDGDGRMYRTRSRKGKIVKQYLDESPGVPLSTCWQDIKQIYGKQGWFPGTQKEGTGYPTQKPLALLERIIKASSNEGDVVLDPFCGCATALVAAEQLGRQWAGIDLSDMAAKLVVSRLEQASGTFWGGKVHHRRDLPRRTDLGKLPNYRTHKHTLYGKQEGLCAGCGTHFAFRNFTIDHVVPQARSGSDHLDNLQLLCGACNSTKGKGTQAELKARLKQQGVI